jgi:hypothetical protein
MRRIHSIALLLCLAGLWGNGIASAQQIVHAIQQPHQSGGHEYPVRASIDFQQRPICGL